MSIKKGNDCHRSLHSIMANTGFGELTIKRGDFHITLPKQAVAKASGLLKKEWNRRLKTPTVADAIWVSQKGGSFSVA